VSTEEKNKALIRRFLEEVWNKGNLDVIDELIAPEFVQHDPASPEEMHGPEDARQYVQMNRNAFPDLRITVEDQVAEGKKVATRVTIRGTHQGDLEGMPPSGNRIEISAITIDRFSGGKFVETWLNSDDLGMMRQLGAILEPGHSEET
jgi:steroid delta-isomerase-like uncharacterized protein